MSDYSDKLKNPKWQKKRLEILNLRGFKCELCKNEEQELHVHHRFYIKGRKPWEYDNDVFQVLCSDCHEKEHSKKEKVVEVVPERYVELIDCIKSLHDSSVDDIVSFIGSFHNTDEAYNAIRLLSCSSHCKWFANVIDYLKDKEALEELKFDVSYLSKKLIEISPDLN